MYNQKREREKEKEGEYHNTRAGWGMFREIPVVSNDLKLYLYALLFCLLWVCFCWIVGFVGHHFVDRNHGRIYDLSAQIDHKESFLLHLFDSHPDLELHLVGHSIGCFLIQEVLKRNERINQRVHSAYFVFPTIENLVHSAPWLRVSINRIFFC